MTPRISQFVDAVLPRVGLALAVYRIGLLTVERDAARKALEIERERRAVVEHRLTRWRDALGYVYRCNIPGELHATVRAILDE